MGPPALAAVVWFETTLAVMLEVWYVTVEMSLKAETSKERCEVVHSPERVSRETRCWVAPASAATSRGVGLAATTEARAATTAAWAMRGDMWSEWTRAKVRTWRTFLESSSVLYLTEQSSRCGVLRDCLISCSPMAGDRSPQVRRSSLSNPGTTLTINRGTVAILSILRPFQCHQRKQAHPSGLLLEHRNPAKTSPHPRTAPADTRVVPHGQRVAASIAVISRMTESADRLRESDARLRRY
jgi:hypothetical protein